MMCASYPESLMWIKDCTGIQIVTAVLTLKPTSKQLADMLDIAKG